MLSVKILFRSPLKSLLTFLLLAAVSFALFSRVILGKLAHEDGYCVIVVTHDMEAAAIADVIYKMRDGVLAMDQAV